MGGVLTVVKGYAEALSQMESRVSIVLTYLENSNCTDVSDLFGKSPYLNINVFRYSLLENRVHVLDKLSKLVSNKSAVLVCNDYLELDMINACKILNPSVLIIHGDYDYYYNLASSSSGFIDKCFSVSPVITDKIKKLLPKHLKHVVSIRYIVNAEKPNFGTEVNRLNAIFIGRLSKAKGFDVLVQVAEKLSAENLNIFWTVVGQPVDVSYKEREWLKSSNVKHFNFLSNLDVLKIYKHQDVLLLPSLQEGYPVVVVEAMKSGVVPIVNNLETIAPDILIDGNTGFRIENNKIDRYIDVLTLLYKDQLLLSTMKRNAVKVANKTFNTATSMSFFTGITEHFEPRQKKFSKTNFSRLDRRYIPNFVVKNIRYLFKLIN